MWVRGPLFRGDVVAVRVEVVGAVLCERHWWEVATAQHQAQLADIPNRNIAAPRPLQESWPRALG